MSDVGADYSESSGSQSAWRPQGNALQLFYQQAMGIPGSQMARTNGRYPDYNFGGAGFGFGAPDIAGSQPSRGGMGGGPQTPLAGGQPAAGGAYESPILNQAGNVQAAGQGWANPLYGIASGQNPVMQGLAGQANGSAALAQNQIDTLSRNLGQFYQQQLNPQIGSNAIGAGGYGGSRQGVAQGVALGQLGNNLAGGITDILSNQQTQGLNASQQYLSNIQQAAPAGQVAAMSPYLASLAPWETMAGILGTGPTPLSQQDSKGGGFSFGF